MPIPRPLFETDFLLHVYKLDEPVDAHKLACVFLVMALGVMFDLTGPPCELCSHSFGHGFHELTGQSALGGRSCLRSARHASARSDSKGQVWRLSARYICAGRIY